MCSQRRLRNRISTSQPWCFFVFVSADFIERARCGQDHQAHQAHHGLRHPARASHLPMVRSDPRQVQSIQTTEVLEILSQSVCSPIRILISNVFPYLIVYKYKYTACVLSCNVNLSLGKTAVPVFLSGEYFGNERLRPARLTACRAADTPRWKLQTAAARKYYSTFNSRQTQKDRRRTDSTALTKTP